MIDAKVTERGAEEDWRQRAAQEKLLVELVGSTLHQFQLIAQLLGQILADSGIQLRVIQPFDDAHFLDGVAFTGLVKVGFIFIEVVNPFEQLAAANRPGDRRAGISIQSDFACWLEPRPFTVPAVWIACPNSSTFSVMVVLPASGCEMIANVRRFATSW